MELVLKEKKSVVTKKCINMKIDMKEYDQLFSAYCGSNGVT